MVTMATTKVTPTNLPSRTGSAPGATMTTLTLDTTTTTTTVINALIVGTILRDILAIETGDITLFAAIPITIRIRLQGIATETPASWSPSWGLDTSQTPISVEKRAMTTIANAGMAGNGTLASKEARLQVSTPTTTRIAATMRTGAGRLMSRGSRSLLRTTLTIKAATKATITTTATALILRCNWSGTAAEGRAETRETRTEREQMTWKPTVAAASSSAAGAADGAEVIVEALAEAPAGVFLGNEEARDTVVLTGGAAANHRIREAGTTITAVTTGGPIALTTARVKPTEPFPDTAREAAFRGGFVTRSITIETVNESEKQDQEGGAIATTGALAGPRTGLEAEAKVPAHRMRVEAVAVAHRPQGLPHRVAAFLVLAGAADTIATAATTTTTTVTAMVATGADTRLPVVPSFACRGPAFDRRTAGIHPTCRHRTLRFAGTALVRMDTTIAVNTCAVLRDLAALTQRRDVPTY